MYLLQAPPAHQDHSQLGSGRHLIGITFQLSSAAACPPSGPGRECRANWAAKLSGGLVGANSASSLLYLTVSIASSLRGSLRGMERSERRVGGTLEAGTGSSVSMNCLGLGPVPKAARFSWTSSDRRPNLRSLSFSVREWDLEHLPSWVLAALAEAVL